MLWRGERIQYYGWIISDPEQEKSHTVPEARRKSSVTMKNGMIVSILVVRVPAVLPKSLCLLLQSLKMYSLPSSIAFYIIIFIYASDLCVLSFLLSTFHISITSAYRFFVNGT